MNATARLSVALALTAIVALVECVGGFAAHSVTLLSDAAHVAMDVLALAIALAARTQALRPATPRQSYGFARMEVLAALGNGALLFTVTAFIVVEAIHRLLAPELPNGLTMAAIAAVGLSVNGLVGITLLMGGDSPHGHAHHGHHHRSDRHDHGDNPDDADHHDHSAPRVHGIAGADHGSQMNMRAVLLHVIGDALGGFAAVVGGLIVWHWHVAWLDPILSLAVAAIIVVGIVRIAREAIEVLLESAPSHADTATVRAHLLEHGGVVDVHDLHIWTLTGAEYLLSGHIVLQDRRLSEASAILRELEQSLQATYAITHVTIQFECESCEEADRIICTPRSNT